MAGTTIRTIEPAGTPGLLTLLTWFSPAFPVGAFAYSHGLEAAVSEGQVGSGEALFDWVRTVLEDGSGWNDLVLVAEARRLGSNGDGSALADLAELALALAGSAERREETMALGAAFAVASRPWSDGVTMTPVAYPVACGVRAAENQVPLADLLTAYAHGFAANLVSAAVRLVPLGQSEAVAVLRRLEPVVEATARRAEVSTLNDLGSCALLSDIAAMRHETLEVRLFRT